MVIVAMVIGANGTAFSLSSGDMIVTRLVNGSATATAQYLPGDSFTVQLDYVVTGKLYAVTINETLPAGWSIADSNAEFSHDAVTNTYSWNITSPLSGVSSGTLLYLVRIPDGALAGSYSITGISKWVNSLEDIEDLEYSGSAPTGTANIQVAAIEGNGPCIWISTPREEIGDGDGHLEADEWAAYDFAIGDKSGVQAYTLYVNGDLCNNITGLVTQPTLVTGTAHGKVTRRADPNDLKNILSIQATDNDGIASTFSLPVYVPNYDYTAWAYGEFSGWGVSAASCEPLSSLTDGGWIVLEGGNPVSLPALETHYAGPAINKAKFTAISNIPYLGQLGLGGFSGDAGATVNVTPRSEVILPMTTYPVYSEYGGANNAAATFYGTPEMGGSQWFHVVLVDTNQLAASVTLNDVINAIDQTDICTNGTGDFRITSAELPGLAGLSQGYYALIVLDYRLPNTPCLVSVAPIVVTETGMTATKVDPVLPMPGDSILFNLNLATDPGSEYMYLMAMVPQDNYSAALDITSDGTLAGTGVAFNGFTTAQAISVSADGKTITVVGKNGTYTFDATDSVSLTASGFRDALISELNVVDVSVANSSITSLTSVDLVLNTKPTMPVGKYVVLSIALDNSTGKVAAFNQTYVDLGMTYDFELHQGWNLVSLPVKPVNNSLFAIFTPGVMSNVTVIWEYNSSNVSSEWRYYTTLGDPYIQGNLSELNEKQGFWVLCKNNTTLRVTGTIPETSDVTLNPDWNLVGNPTMAIRNVRDVYTTSFVVWEYESLTQSYDYWCRDADNPGSIYIQGTLTTLKPCYGYWVLIS